MAYSKFKHPCNCQTTLKTTLVLLYKLFLCSCLWLIELTISVVLVLTAFLLQRCLNMLYFEPSLSSSWVVQWFGEEGVCVRFEARLLVFVYFGWLMLWNPCPTSSGATYLSGVDDGLFRECVRLNVCLPPTLSCHDRLTCIQTLSICGLV